MIILLFISISLEAIEKGVDSDWLFNEKMIAPLYEKAGQRYDKKDYV